MISMYKLLLISFVISFYIFTVLSIKTSSTSLLFETVSLDDPLDIQLLSLKDLLDINDDINSNEKKSNNIQYMKIRYNTELYKYIQTLHNESIVRNNDLISIDSNLLKLYSNEFESYLVKKFNLRSKPIFFNFNKLFDPILFKSAAAKTHFDNFDIQDNDDEEEESIFIFYV